MGRVRLAAQGIDDPQIKARQRSIGASIKVFHVSGIGQALALMIKAHAGRFNVAVQLRERGDEEIAQHHRRFEIMGRAGCGIAGGAEEHIIKARFQHRECCGVGPHVHRAAHGMEDLAQIINAMGVIGMIMGDDHRIKVRHPGRQQLFAAIRPAIDQHGLAGGLNQYGDAAAAVLRVFRVAQAPVPCPIRPADPWHTAGCSAAEDGDLHAAFVKSAWKLAVVVPASSASLTPRRAERKRAVWATKAGSQVLPRIGTGAR